jgi:hypothetical protein
MSVATCLEELGFVQGLRDAMGKDSKLKDSFQHFKNFGITKMAEVGAWEIRVPWKSADEENKVLSHHQESIVALDDPEHQGMLYPDYVKAHGEPSVNGLGHKRCTIMGKDLVIIPGPKIFKIRSTQQFRADLRTTVDDESNVVGEGQMQANFSELAGAIMMPEATGVSMDVLFGTRPAPTPPAAQAASAVAQQAAPYAGWGFDIQVQTTAGQPQIPTPEKMSGSVEGVPPEPGSRGRKNKNPGVNGGNGSGSGGGGVGGGNDKGKRGRPKRNVKAVAAEFIMEFRACTPGSPYFQGKEQYVHKKWMETLVDDLEKEVAAEKTAAVKDELTVLLKQATVVTDVTKPSVVEGPGCSLFRDHRRESRTALPHTPPPPLIHVVLNTVTPTSGPGVRACVPRVRTPGPFVGVADFSVSPTSTRTTSAGWV